MCAATDSEPVFAASHRRLPHVGSKVAFLGDDVLREVAGHNLDGAELGFFAPGGVHLLRRRQATRPQALDADQIARCRDEVPGRTSGIPSQFRLRPRGFGKSNLVKLLFSNLYKGNPQVEKRKAKKVAVGTVIFDPDGEYFWPDDKNRPGLCDVPQLEDKVVVFTRRAGPSAFYQSFVAGSIKLDIRRLRPSDVISIALSPERQDQQNVRKLKGLNDTDCADL